LTGQHGWVELNGSRAIEANQSGAASGFRIGMNAAADSGISAMNDTRQYVMIDSPIGTGKVPCPVKAWEAASVITDSSLSRTATNVGFIIRPTSRNGFVYECMSAAAGSSTSATEPTWSTTVGEYSDDADVGWVCRNEETFGGNGKGFIMGSGIATNADVWHFEAYRCHKDVNLGDAANGDLHII